MEEEDESRAEEGDADEEAQTASRDGLERPGQGHLRSRGVQLAVLHPPYLTRSSGRWSERGQPPLGRRLALLSTLSLSSLCD